MHHEREEAAPGVHRIGDGWVNWYLVEGGDGSVTVVDAGLPRSWETLRAVLGELGRGPGDVAAIVLTHAHFDHVGFVARAQRELGVPVYLRAAERELASHPRHYPRERSLAAYVWRPDAMRSFASFGARGALRTEPVREFRPLPDGGAAADVPGRPVVVDCPGHTAGHVALHLADRDCLIAGDALVTLDPYTGMAGPRLVAKGATTDSAAAEASLRRLAGLQDARIVLTGHGPTWAQGIAAAAEAAAGRQA
jgi:glyoxylase-like metal-dependent hydrolase (beta-lactamase superfamily II)